MNSNVEKILDGSLVANSILEYLKKEISQLSEKPGLATIIVGENKASQIYVKNKIKTCEKIGIKSFNYCLKKDVKKEEVFSLIKKLNIDKNVHGILLQLPLPDHINSFDATNAILPEKDVDGFTQKNAGNLFLNPNLNSFVSCTPLGIIKLLKYYNIPIEKKNVVIIGRSNIVAKPLGMLFLQKNATVTFTHSYTKDLKNHTQRADILVSAVGKPKFITSDMVKENSIIIDVGINRLENKKIVGDVDFDNVIEKVSKITPVPGGVGPLTIAMLMQNTLKSFKNKKNGENKCTI